MLNFSDFDHTDGSQICQFFVKKHIIKWYIIYKVLLYLKICSLTSLFNFRVSTPPPPPPPAENKTQSTN